MKALTNQPSERTEEVITIMLLGSKDVLTQEVHILYNYNSIQAGRWGLRKKIYLETGFFS